MHIDGIAASQARDTSAERIDIENMDISSLQAGTGLLNWEHKDPKRDKNATALDIVGSISFAKKIFGPKDCDDDRQLQYWKQIELPFVYIRGELFDAEGHETAKAVAAIFRFYWKRKLPSVARLSIDGITVERKDNELTLCLARDVAITMKPANHSCVAGVDKDDWKASEEEPYDKLARSEEGLTRMTGVSFTMMPFDDEQEDDVEAEDLSKAMSFSGADVAPGMLRGADALAKEHVVFRSRLKAAVRDWPRKQKLSDHLKKSLPDVNTDIIDKFVDILDQRMLNKASELYASLDKAALRGQALEDAIAQLPTFTVNPDKGARIGTKPLLDDGELTSNLKDPSKGSKNPAQAPRSAADPEEFESTITTKEDRQRKMDAVNADIKARPTVPPQLGVSQEAAEAHVPGLRVGMHPGEAHKLDAAAMAVKSEDIEAEDLIKDEDVAKAKKPKAARVAVQPPKLAAAQSTRAAKLKPATEPESVEPLTVGGKSVPIETQDPAYFDAARGALVTPRGTLPMDVLRDPSHAKAFSVLLADPASTRLHDYATQHWIELNKRMRAGTLPPEVLMHAVLFAQMSPQTAVPVQELMYGHLADYMKDNKIDARDPAFAADEHREGWKALSHPTDFPKVSPEHFDRIKDLLQLKSDSAASGRVAGQNYAFQKPDQKFNEYVAKYHGIHDRLVDVINRHRDNAHGINAELINSKGESAIPGLGAKTTPYMLGMLGAGNTVVADTHFTRHIFGLDLKKDAATIEHVKRLLWDTKSKEGVGQKILEGINQYYHQNHPAVQYMQQHPRYGNYFQEHSSQVLFPAFWRHWMTVPDHEVAVGRTSSKQAKNQGTNHQVFFDAIKGFLQKSEIPSADRMRRYVALHLQWAQEYGEIPAQMMYYAFIVPLLLGASDTSVASLATPPQDGSGGQITTDEPDLAKAEAAADHASNHASKPSAKFNGKSVQPGVAEFRAGTTHPLAGQKLELLGHDGTHFHMRNAQGSTIRVAGDHEHKAFKIVQPATPVHEANVVQDHHLSQHSRSPEQMAMMLGLDINQDAPPPEHGISALTKRAGFYHGPKGKVFVKEGDEAPWGIDGADAETAYANIARGFFGLSDIVPTTATFNHPVTGRPHSAQQVVDGEHGEQTDGHRAAWHKSGIASRMATTDFLLGNDDRHIFNYLVKPDGGPALIDHGNAFQYGEQYGHPHYVDGLRKHDEFPPETHKWIASLNPQEFEAQLDKNGVPPEAKARAVRRLQKLQAVIADGLPLMYSTLNERYPMRQE